MALTRSQREPRYQTIPPPSGRARVRVTDALLPIALGLWALGIGHTHVTSPGPLGLPPDLPIVFYGGVAVLVVSAAIELARPRPSGWRMSVHAIELVVMLYGTAPLVYREGRYSWLYKTIGVVQYVNAHGQLNRHIDIYQNWPGFFAFAAWFGRVAGVPSPLAYAKWFQLVVELAALPLLYLIYDALSLTVRQRWTAILLYSAGNWIAQDYFSPQALGTLFSLGIMAMAMSWLYVGNPPRFRRLGQIAALPAQHNGVAKLVDIARHQTSHVSTADTRRLPRRSTRAKAHLDGHGVPPRERYDRAHPWRSQWRVGPSASCCAVILLTYFVLTFTHELSPYMVAVQLGILVIIRMLRPRWLPLAMAAIALGYLLPHFSFVNSHYGLLNSLGKFFSNASPPSFSTTAARGSQILIERSADLLSVGMWGLAALGAWLHRRSGRSILSLALLACSPVLLLVLLAYGHEGILRVYLFSLPWSAGLAAMALTPLRRAAGRSAQRRRQRRTSARGGAWHSYPASTALTFARIALALGAAITLFFPAFFGDDSFNVMPPSEVATVTSFLRSATPGRIYCPVDDAPLADTARYNRFPLTQLYGSYGIAKKDPSTPDILNLIAKNSYAYNKGKQPTYVIVTSTMRADSEAHGAAPPNSFRILLSKLGHSPFWQLIAHRPGVVIYELTPIAAYAERIPAVTQPVSKTPSGHSTRKSG